MTSPFSESAIVSALAEAVSKRICMKTVRVFEELTDTQSGDDSGLVNIWEEICVQVQHEQSVMWDVYDDMVRDTVGHFASKVAAYEKQALWLLTPDGEDWRNTAPEDRDPHPSVDESDIAEHLVGLVYREAADWTNARIEAYLARENSDDDEDDEDEQDEGD